MPRALRLSHERRNRHAARRAIRDLAVPCAGPEGGSETADRRQPGPPAGDRVLAVRRDMAVWSQISRVDCRGRDRRRHDHAGPAACLDKPVGTGDLARPVRTCASHRPGASRSPAPHQHQLGSTLDPGSALRGTGTIRLHRLLRGAAPSRRSGRGLAGSCLCPGAWRRHGPDGLCPTRPHGRLHAAGRAAFACACRRTGCSTTRHCSAHAQAPARNRMVALQPKRPRPRCRRRPGVVRLVAQPAGPRFHRDGFRGPAGGCRAATGRLDRAAPL